MNIDTSWDITRPDTTSREFFDRKYRENPDPWQFASDAYELDRYQATIAALAGRRYDRAFEPGCSIGILTAQIAELSGQVQALDISPAAVAKARENCRELPHVEIRCGTLPDDIPSGSFDLVVFSEIGYYFHPEQLRRIAGMLVQRLLPAGTFLAVHWLGTSPDHLLSGDQVHELLAQTPGLLHRQGNRTPGFRLDLWTRL